MDPRILALVGSVTDEQLRFVESFLSSRLGIFVPVLGQCGYAITPSHTHPAWMVLVLSGEIPVSEVPSAPAPPGFHLRILAPGVPHQELPSDEPNRYYAVMIESLWFESIADSMGVDPQRFNWEPYPASERLLYLLRDFMREHDMKSPVEVMDALALLVVSELLRCTCDEPTKPALANPEAALRGVVEMMEHRCQADWKLADLARAASMSVSTFQRAFRTSLGCSPMAYLQSLRIRRASQLLRMGKSLSRAAADTGFSSVSHFSEAFRKVMKQSPNQYKKSHLGQNDQIRRNVDRIPDEGPKPS